MHHFIDPPKLVIELYMQSGEAKPQNVNRQVVRKLLSEYTPSAELRRSVIDSINIEGLERDTLRITVAIRKNFAPESVEHFVATMQAEFTRAFKATQAKGYFEVPQAA